MDDTPTQINLLTLNVWGLKYISKLRRERLEEIGRQLAIADPQPHIVALQECFTEEDYRSIRRETRFMLPYGKYYYSGSFGGGLAILSRWPIEESSVFRYPLNGRPTAFFRGDWYVGKGVACAKIRYGPGPKHIVEVFNTHTHSPYESGPNDSYLCHRTSQAWEMAKLLRGAAERGHLVVALGDFNMLPLSLQHRIITAHSPVRDVWRVLHPESSVGPADHPAEQARRRPIPTAEFNIIENGAASDGPYNTWRWTKEQQKLLGPGKPEVTVAPDTIDRRGKRIDYIFTSTGDASALGGYWAPTRASVGMMMRHPHLNCSLSDHFAVEATLEFHRPSSSSSSPPHHPHPTTTPYETSTLKPRGPSKQSSLLSSNPKFRPDSETIAHDVFLRAPAGATPEPSGHDDAETFDARTMSTHIPAQLLDNGTFLNLAPQHPSPAPSEAGGGGHHHHLDDDLSQKKEFGGGGGGGAAQTQASLGDEQTVLPGSVYDDMLAVLERYVRREESQRKWRGRHFFAAVAGTVACSVGVFWSPHNYVAFILLLVSSLGLVAGTIDGLLALLFFNSELRALKEFEWEVTNAKGGRDDMDDDQRAW
ncbi:hypothetical protein QBC39DRAFT_416274 [Podospora conica]|nr:hypothetical protein QBC39DRAFT_416274 [Schizothecium conicum]